VHPRTIAALEELEQAAWFSRVGVKDTNAAVVLSSWQEAVEHCGSPEWEDLCLEASNQYRERLAERSRDSFIKWNEVVRELKKATTPLVARKVESVVRENGLPKVFETMVRWDITGVCIEAEFADVYPPGFFARSFRTDGDADDPRAWPA
jgi:hypothetical protein